MTAFEELKAWCEKHLAPDLYKVVPESPSFCATIYFAEYTDTGVGMVCFSPSGSVAGLGALDEEDMIEHIQDYERAEEKAPDLDSMSTLVSGHMVQQMIEAYERNMNK